MGIKEFYYSLEDKYFEMLDNLEEKGINLYKIVDPLEKNGIPTFPIYILLILAIIGLLIFLLLPVLGITGGQDGTALRFVDETNNPLSNKTINATLNEQPRTLITNKDGFVYLDLQERPYTLKLTDNTYGFSGNQESLEINPAFENNYLINLEKLTSTKTKTILLKTQSGEAMTSSVAVEFSCTGRDYKKIATITGGEYTLTDVPRDCGSLIVDIPGRSDYVATDLETKTEITFSSSYSNATLSIKLKDKDQDFILPNLSVSIYDLTGYLVDTGQTNANGLFISEYVQVSKTYRVIVSDPEGYYSGITDLDYQNGLQTPVTIKTGINNAEFRVKKDVIGTIQIKVKDKTTGQVLEGVVAKLSKGSALIESKTTDTTGFAKFGVRENTNYILVLDKPGYFLSPPQQVSISNNIQEFTLKSLDATATSIVNISVTDKDLVPLDNAVVKIWDALNNSVVKIVTADVSGRVTLLNLDPNVTYFAEAIVGEFSGKTNNFNVKDREATDVPIIVSIGQGTYNLTILNMDGTPYSQATIKVYDAAKNIEMVEKQTTTSETGLSVIPVRADKSVYFVIEKEGSRIISKQYSVTAEGMTKDTIYIPTNVSSSANIELIGYFANNGDQLASLGPGQSATARFIVNVDKRYSKVVAHIRTGEGETCDNKTHTVTDDSIFIKQVKFSGTKTIGSINYTPCLGETKDMSSIIKKDGKWFNIILDNPIEGSHIIDADIVVTDTATSNQSLFYRAEYHQGSSVLRNPQDNIIGTSTTSSIKQALYAYAKKLPIYVGDSTGCENKICYTFSIKDKTTGVEKRIIDKFTAKDGTDYKFNFRLNLERPANDAVLIVSTSGQTIKLNNYTITPGGNLPITDNDFSNIFLGNISANGTVNGEIDLSVINDISDELTITLLSNTDTILVKKILFDLKPSKKLVVDIVPKTIVPFVPNFMSVGVTDESGIIISDATVLARINNKPIVDGKTNKEGIFTFILPSPNTNDNIEIIVRKPNYRTNTTKLVVSESIVATIPDKLDIQLDISQGYSNKTDLILLNNSILPLAITNIQSNINSEYIKITSNSQGIVLDPNTQISVEISTKLTESGIDLMTQKVIKGNLLIHVNEATLGKTWIIEVPVTVRITFGNAVDNTDCLEIEPEEITLRADSPNNLEYNLKVKNSCTVENVPADVGRIFVEADYKNTKKLGDFYVVVSGQEKKLSLDEKIETLTKIVAGKQADIKLIFKVNNSAKSGMSTPIIKITSNRPNTGGIDILESQHRPKIILNNYVSCIETPTSPITIPYCSGFGYGVFGGTNSINFNPLAFSQNPYATSGMAGQSFYSTPLNGYPNSFGNFYNSYNEQTPAGYPGTGFTTHGQFGCQSAQIQIKNNCYEELSLQFSSVGGVNISKNAEMTLKKGQSQMLEVQGAQILGQYKISMSAKPNDDTIDDYTYVKDIPVVVNRPVSILPENCISISPTKFDFSGIDTTPKKLMVINSCYDAGYALVDLKILNIEMSDYEDIEFFSIGDVNKELKPRKSYRVIDGKTTEIMAIQVRRNPEVTEKILRTDSDGSTAKAVTNLRKNYFDLGKAINATALLGIGYSNPRMSYNEIEKEIILTDNLQWLGYVDQFKDTSSTLTGKEPSVVDGGSSQGQSSSQASGTAFSDYFKDAPALAEGRCYDPKGTTQKGFTGKDNYEKFGFNRLLFNYNESLIPHNACDYGQVYCDQDQLRIAMSKKINILKSGTGIVALDLIAFRKDTSTGMIAKADIKNNPIDKATIENIVNAKDFSGDSSSQMATIKTILTTVPTELRKFTIITIKVEGKTTQEPTPVTLSDANIEAYVKTITNSTYNKYGTTYQFNVNSFLANEDKILQSTDATEQAKVAGFLNQFINTMDIYYGDTVSPFIINAKTYGTLDSGLSNDIFTSEQFISNATTIKLESNSQIKSITAPGTYMVTISGRNITPATFKVEAVTSDILNYYKNNPSYKDNIFFTNPTNAHYYDYSGVPFGSGFAGTKIATSIISSYSKNWANVQDGYILKVPTKQAGMSFKDIRPIQTLANADYVVDYLADGKYNLITSTNRKDTIFAFYNLQDSTRGADYQLKIYSTAEMNFNVNTNKLEKTTKYSDIYGIPKNLSSISKYTKEETSSVSNMITGIDNNTMCFDFTTSGFILWYNPLSTKQ